MIILSLHMELYRRRRRSVHMVGGAANQKKLFPKVLDTGNDDSILKETVILLVIRLDRL